MVRSQVVEDLPHGGVGPASQPSGVAAQTPGAGPVWPTLLDVAGGAPGVQRIVDRLVRRLLRDPLIAPSLDDVDLIRLKRAQARFFTDAFSAVRVHEPLTPLSVRVSGEQFTRVMLHVHQTIVSLDLPETLTEQLMLAVLARGLVGDDPNRLTRA
jgi:truncated hemoglobin YjbI